MVWIALLLACFSSSSFRVSVDGLMQNFDSQCFHVRDRITLPVNCRARGSSEDQKVASSRRANSETRASSTNATEKEYLIMHCRDDSGMFSCFDDVLTLLKCYDKGLYNGVEIDFIKQGLYYSPEYGDNWWTYYCEPICLGTKINVRHITGEIPGSIPWEAEKHTSRHEAKRLIDKYIKLKSEIMDKIAQFQIDNFVNNYVITVHYRGTDKIIEAPAVAYGTVSAKVDEIMRDHGHDRCKIFIATDEQKFLNYMLNHYGDLICYNTEAIRSIDGNPLHTGNYDRYQCGLDAIVDAVLLSRGQHMIRMSSNLSRWSTFFNPSIPVYELNQRY